MKSVPSNTSADPPMSITTTVPVTARSPSRIVIVVCPMGFASVPFANLIFGPVQSTTGVLIRLANSGEITETSAPVSISASVGQFSHKMDF